MTNMDILKENWPELLLAIITLLSTYTALTETDKDDKFIDIVRSVVLAIIAGTTGKKK